MNQMQDSFLRERRMKEWRKERGKTKSKGKSEGREGGRLRD